MGVLPPASAKHGCPPCTLAPCIGSAPHTPAARPLPSLQVCGWFAARCDLILLLFDPYKLDISDEFTRQAKPFWEAAGVAHKIDLRLAPAVESMDALLAEGRAGSYDFCFIDADKHNYDLYYERALQLLRQGGLIAIDNVLWGGDVADPNVNDPDTAALKALNEKLHGDTRVTLSLVPIGDGLTLARKR